MGAAPRLRTVVVLYHPDRDAIDMVISIARQGYDPVVVANAINATSRAALLQTGVDLVINAENVGLATAFNQGIDRALSSGADYVMLLDQDTRPPADMGVRLLALAEQIEASGRPLGCIGPVPVDRKKPAAQTLARRAASQDSDPDLIEVATIISSGMVIPRVALEAIGGMWNELFIDHIDHEWCFRVSRSGRGVFVAGKIEMPHDMGDAGLHLFGRYKPIHRSPVRHFHIVRNTLWLARCAFIPRQWRLVEIAKLLVRIPAYLVFSSSRAQTVRSVYLAVKVGLHPPPKQTYSAPPTQS